MASRSTTLLIVIGIVAVENQWSCSVGWLSTISRFFVSSAQPLLTACDCVIDFSDELNVKRSNDKNYLQMRSRVVSPSHPPAAAVIPLSNAFPATSWTLVLNSIADFGFTIMRPSSGYKKWLFRVLVLSDSSVLVSLASFKVPRRFTRNNLVLRHSLIVTRGMCLFAFSFRKST